MIDQETVKTCKKHGKLTANLVHQKGKSHTSGNPYYGCNLCKKEQAKKYNENNSEIIKKKRYEYDQKRKLKEEFIVKKKKWMHDYQKRKRKNKPNEVRKKDREYKRIYVKRHREKINQRMKDMITNLHPCYVRNVLKYQYGFDNPSDDLVDCKSSLMLLRREIMKINFNQGKNKYVSKTGKGQRRYQNKHAEDRIIKGSTQNFRTCKDLKKTDTNNI